MHNLELHEQRKKLPDLELTYAGTPYRLRWNLKHCLCYVWNRRKKTIG
jgi:hypothetical protein